MITSGSGAAIPNDPLNAAQSGLGFPTQAGPVENRTTQNFLGVMGVPGYQAPATPNGPYATAYLGREARKVEQYRAQTRSAFSTDGVQGNFYVYTGYSDKATTSFRSMDDLMSEFEAMPVKQKEKLAKTLALAGFLDGDVEEATLMDVTDAYADLLGSAAARFAQGQNMTINDLLEMNIRYNIGREADDAEFSIDKASGWYDKLTGATGKPRTETRTDKSIDLFSPEDARGLTRSALQSVLGRDPSEAEYEDFLAALQTHARNNPQVTKTTTRYDANGNVVGTNSVSRGGLSEAGVSNILQDQAEAAPDWAEWQAIGTYLPAVFDALGSAVPNA